MDATAALTNSSIAKIPTFPSGWRVILSLTPSVRSSAFILKSSNAAKTSGSATSPSRSNIAGSPSSENLSLTTLTPKAKSESSSKKSSTAKSPSSCIIPQAAGNVSSRHSEAIIIGRLPVPELTAILCRSCFLALFSLTGGTVSLPFLCIHSSNETRTRGAHNPVSKNAANTPKAASIPNDLRAATSLNRFAANAAIVVRVVSIIALPTLLTVISPEVIDERPRVLSSL